MQNNIWIKVAALLGFLGVSLGAFGGHVLKARLSEELMDIFQVGIQYHLVHVVALFALALYGSMTKVSIRIGGLCFALGIVIFSGSLYALSITGIRSFGAITPIGGVLFLLGWTWVFFQFSGHLTSKQP
jgi:uncharacterized membrane protein YgdD (TMEM256/DUF423 family)